MFSHQLTSSKTAENVRTSQIASSDRPNSLTFNLSLSAVHLLPKKGLTICLAPMDMLRQFFKAWTNQSKKKIEKDEVATKLEGPPSTRPPWLHPSEAPSIIINSWRHHAWPKNLEIIIPSALYGQPFPKRYWDKKKHRKSPGQKDKILDFVCPNPFFLLNLMYNPI